jgi:hypothetical protein
LIVVSDTSPILNLARIGRLELLQSLYRQVVIPSAVYAELTDARRDLPPAIDLGSMSWLMVAAASNRDHVEQLLGAWTLARLRPSSLRSNFEPICFSWTKGAAAGLPALQAWQLQA